ncbi:MAG: hypothetical protein VKL39_19845 [Leptolyngbyaceae bacterium]|nr:hypothetical protein [Leptolyngbyaceae bacterium]
MKRTALALAITTILGIEFGYIPSSFSLSLPEQVSANEQASNNVLVSSEYSSYTQDIECQNQQRLNQQRLSPKRLNQQTPRYQPTNVGLPSRREGGGTR